MVVPAPAGRAGRTFPNAAVPIMMDPEKPAAEQRQNEAETSGNQDVLILSGPELGMAVAREVMHWRSDHEQFADCWVDDRDRLTGYYYGRPFSPYRDRNALAEVWKRIDELGLRSRYLACLDSVLGAALAEGRAVDAWSLHTCHPEVACRAALLAVRAGTIT